MDRVAPSDHATTTEPDRPGKGISWRWFLGSAIGIAGIGLLVLWAQVPKDPITAHNILKIDKGLTVAEVEAIFGVPPGDYSTERKWNEERIIPPFTPDGKPREGNVWGGDSHLIVVQVDDHGIVTDYNCMCRGYETWADILRRRLRLP